MHAWWLVQPPSAPSTYSTGQWESGMHVQDSGSRTYERVTQLLSSVREWLACTRPWEHNGCERDMHLLSCGSTRLQDSGSTRWWEHDIVGAKTNKRICLGYLAGGLHGASGQHNVLAQV